MAEGGYAGYVPAPANVYSGNQLAAGAYDAFNGASVTGPVTAGGGQIGASPTPSHYSTSIGQEWRDLYFSIGEIAILKGVTGLAEPGKLTAVMGPSGSGKTTLLNVLSGRQRTYGYSRTGNDKQSVEFKGETFCRGTSVTTSFYRGRTAYVPQDNALLDSDTPQECLEFSAYLRLPNNVGETRRAELVTKLIKDLHLELCKDIIVGGPLRKGLSGGEQKRTAVGVELISEPQMLFLDEPLSGLDSYNAFTLMQTLKKLARSGVPIMITVHQPSSEIYEMIDDIIFLHRGEVVFQGQREAVGGHFADLGFRCPPSYNPADFVMLTIQQEDEETLKSIKARFRESLAFKDLNKRIGNAGQGFDSVALYQRASYATADDSDDEEEASSSEDDDEKVFGQIKPKRQRSWFEVQCALIQRDARRTWRDKQIIIAGFVQNMFVSIIYGLLFIGAGSEASKEGSVMSNIKLSANSCADDPALFASDQCVRAWTVHWGGLSIVAINAMMASITWAISVFQSQRPCFLRECAGGYYTALNFFLSKTVFEFPLIAISSTITLLCVYWLMGLKGNFFMLTWELMLLSLASSSMVFCLSAGASTPEQAYALSPIVQIPQFAFAGILLPNEMIPSFFRWVKWICPLYYGMNLMAISEFDDLFERWANCTEQAGSTPDAAVPIGSPLMDVYLKTCPGTMVQIEALRSQGVQRDYFCWPALSMSLVIIVLFRTLGVFILWRKSRFVL